MMQVIKYPQKESWQQLLRRPLLDFASLTNTVKNILDDVKQNGDESIKKYTDNEVITAHKSSEENILELAIIQSKH